MKVVRVRGEGYSPRVRNSTAEFQEKAGVLEVGKVFEIEPRTPDGRTDFSDGELHQARALHECLLRLSAERGLQIGSQIAAPLRDKRLIVPPKGLSI